MSLVCSRCGKDNPDENRFCSRCGLELDTPAATSTDEIASLPCYRHPKEMTVLRCGKCDRPICHKCVVMSPAGTRCRECSRPDTAGAKGALVDAKLGVRRIFSGRINYWGFALLFLLISALLRTCESFNSRPPQPPRSQESFEQ